MAKYNPAGTDLLECVRRDLQRIGSWKSKLDMNGDGTISTSSGSVEDIIYARDAVNNYITRKLGSHRHRGDCRGQHHRIHVRLLWMPTAARLTSSGNSGNIRKDDY